MSTVQGSLASQERLRWLSDRLISDGSVTVAAAASALEVSEMTIRRDLAELEERGTARRVRGGATAMGPQSFASRHATAARAKSRIASKLAELVPAAGALAFDASSTILRLASALDAARDVTVLTNGPETFAALQDQRGVTALLTGGRLEARTGSLVGPLACRSAEQLSVRTFFLSAAAIDPTSGASETTLEEAEVKRAIAERADQVVLAVDASKLNAQAMAIGVGWERIDLLVTDLDPADDRLEAYQALAGVL